MNKQLLFITTFGSAMMIVGLLTVTGATYADTIQMNNGVQVHGNVLKTEGGRVYVQVGPRVIRLHKSEIANIEENEKDGSLDMEAIQRAAAERDRELTEQYGLSGEERQWIIMQIALLTDNDPVKRREAERALLKKALEKDIFPFLKDTVESSLPWSVPALLRIMAEIDPRQTQQVARYMTGHPEEHARAVAVEVLGLTQDTASQMLMIRGLLDHTPVVKMAACSALAAIKAKEATPLLIKRLHDVDLRVERYAREALAVIWEVAWEEAEKRSIADWNTFWQEQSVNVPITVDMESLEPLVPPGTRFEQC